jgi:hypothetical protein
MSRPNYMADYDDKMSFVRAVCEAGPKWNAEQKKAAARALFWLCDFLREDVQQRCPKAQLDYVSNNVRALQSYADEWARSGDINFEDLMDYLRRLTGWVPDEPFP